MTATTLMVQGTTSSAGKSALVTGLCRLYARRGYSVAPFKAQNMALNSFVTPDGGEIGRSQAVQAEACGLVPSTAMNPVLLKPHCDHTSQVIVRGKVKTTLNAKEYYAWRHTLKPTVRAAFAELAAAHDLIILEGAGSPAEINLREHDLVNMGMAVMADAPVILVGDIERGGVFASLYGTVRLLEKAEQDRIKGLVINRFRGDVSILRPGLAQIEALLHIPVLGVLPYWDVRIDEEDSLAERIGRDKRAGPEETEIAVIRLPRMANFTDFGIFDLLPGVTVRYVELDASLHHPDMVILPGTKSTMADMLALQESHMAEQLLAYHASGGVIAGICGGYQMLGHSIADPDGVESEVLTLEGLHLLDIATVFVPDKQTVQTAGTVLPLPGVLAGAAGLTVEGYEIHMGRTQVGPASMPLVQLGQGEEGACSPDGRIFGTYLHGIFDSVPLVRALVDALRARKGLAPGPAPTDLPETFRAYRLGQYDRLADILEASLDIAALDAIIRNGA